MRDFTIYQGGIFRKLREGTGEVFAEEFFYRSIKQQIESIAAGCGAVVTVNPSRMKEAQDLWNEDLKSLISDKKIQDSPYPCEFKHAAFLCFWLRRRLVIETVGPKSPGQPVDRDFMEFKSEYVAFHIALRLVVYHVYFPAGHPEKTMEPLKNWNFPSDLAREAMVMLHHKNVSPHALYLFFRALVTQLPPPAAKLISVNSN